MTFVKGYKQTEEHRRKNSESRKGKKLLEETKKKISLKMKGKIPSNILNNNMWRGEKNPKWVKDRTLLKRYSNTAKERGSPAYVEWRKQVWIRDKFKCRIEDENCFGKIEAHHILSWKDYPELRYKINNGITLCHAHHPRKRAEEKRLSPYFMELVSVSKE